MLQALIGLAIGIPVAIFCVRYVKSQLYEITTVNVPVMAVGIGTPQGRPIPDGVSFWGEAVYKRNRQGGLHISRLDEDTLKKIADTTHGVFIQGDSDQALASIQTNLDGLQKTEMKGQGAMRREEWAPSLGALSAGALLLSALI